MQMPVIPLWAKLYRRGDGSLEKWHSLIDHSADVAATTEALAKIPVVAGRLARLAGRSLDAITVSRLAVLAALHDIGKANRGFRSRFRPGVKGAGHIQPMAWLLHGSGSGGFQERLSEALRASDWEGWFSEGAWPLVDAVFAHHGRPWRKENLDDCTRLWHPGPDMDPIADLAVIGDALPHWFPDAFTAGPMLPDSAPFQHAFAGLLMLADWLGSDEQFFPMANGEDRGRMAFARSRAPEALATVGLAVAPTRLFVSHNPPDFAAAFGVASPRPVQQMVTIPEANCVVLEAETGSGKTEAALWRFLHLFRDGKVDGLYFALPTRVAATQAFHRILRFCDRVFGAERPAVVLAVPGQQMADGVRGHSLPDFGFAWDDDPQAGARLTRWAAEHPKRFLAAQIAVGTIDQALLGAIQVRHAHLRGTALLRHLLVVDEVHASDQYMQRLLGSLLHSHTQAGGHALLLSATLGAGMRSHLLGGAVPSLEAAEAAPYPALSWAEGGGSRSLEVRRTEREKTVTVETAPMLDDPAAAATMALAAARQGAKVLVIRNTVGAAVATQQALEALEPAGKPLFRLAGVPTLHHGRFAPSDRRLLDAEVERCLGKERQGGGLVVVGTQTLEISLDLDADLLLTDLCPADVLLQRMGRLHRHERQRPPGFDTPRTVVLVPGERDLLPFAMRTRHGLGGQVYDDLRAIEATWRLIEMHPVWRIPAMNRHLVERSTHPSCLAAVLAELTSGSAAWTRWFTTAQGGWSGKVQQAGYALLDRDAPFDRLVFDPDDRLATRLGAADRLVTFAPPLPGPFGVDVAELRIPSHLLRGATETDEPADVVQGEGAITFSLAGARFHYDRWGLRRA